jgi:hypothetical protein
MKLSALNFKIKEAPEIRSFILENYGIDAEVKDIDGKPAIMVQNHFSMFSIVSKIRKDFSFTIYHQANTNIFIIYLNLQHGE